MKQSTFSAVMANKLLTVLQGYTKGMRFVAVLTMLLTLGIGQAWAWCGNSFIIVNDTWCTGSNSYVHTGGKFDGKNLGTLTTLKLGGELQVYPASNTAASLYYKIDGGSEKSISLPKTGNDGNNSKHSGSGTIDLSTLSGGTHTIEVWFKHGSDYDSNNSNNYKATFTIDPVVTFKANGGTGDDYTQKVTYNTSTALTANTFTRTGYTFAGWNTKTDGTGTSYTDKQKVTLTSNTTLYAQWKTKSYVITWVVDGIVKQTGGVVHGSKPVPPTLEPGQICGDKFVGWVTTPIEGKLKDAPANIYTTENLPAITGNVTFYAVFADYEN